MFDQGFKMRVMVTGGSGFLGSRIADALTAAGHQVVIYDRTKSRWLSLGQTINIGNVLDADGVRAVMAGCEVVYHLAAMANINDAIDRPPRPLKSTSWGETVQRQGVRLHTAFPAGCLASAE